MMSISGSGTILAADLPRHGTSSTRATSHSPSSPSFYQKYTDVTDALLAILFSTVLNHLHVTEYLGYQYQYLA